MNIGDAFNGLISSLVQLLPASPFAGVIDSLASVPYLSWLNWFFPVRACLAVMLAWLTAISLFYLYSVVARWVKLIGD